MAINPIPGNVDEETAESQQDPRIGPNVSPKHRAILEAALAQKSDKSFFEVLASMPDVGDDSDFAPNRG
jgi:hypothetical protein